MLFSGSKMDVLDDKSNYDKYFTSDGKIRGTVPLSLRYQDIVKELFKCHYFGSDRSSRFYENFNEREFGLVKGNDIPSLIVDGVIISNDVVEDKWSIVNTNVASHHVRAAYRFVMQYTLVVNDMASGDYYNVKDNYPAAFAPVTGSLVAVLGKACVPLRFRCSNGAVCSASAEWMNSVCVHLSKDKYLVYQILSLPVRWNNIETKEVITEFGNFIIADRVVIKSLPSISSNVMRRFSDLHGFGAALYNNDYLFGRDMSDDTLDFIVRSYLVGRCGDVGVKCAAECGECVGCFLGRKTKKTRDFYILSYEEWQCHRVPIGYGITVYPVPHMLQIVVYNRAVCDFELMDVSTINTFFINGLVSRQYRWSGLFSCVARMVTFGDSSVSVVPTDELWVDLSSVAGDVNCFNKALEENKCAIGVSQYTPKVVDEIAMCSNVDLLTVCGEGVSSPLAVDDSIRNVVFGAIPWEVSGDIRDKIFQVCPPAPNNIKYVCTALEEAILTVVRGSPSISNAEIRKKLHTDGVPCQKVNVNTSLHNLFKKGRLKYKVDGMYKYWSLNDSI